MTFTSPTSTESPTSADLSVTSCHQHRCLSTIKVTLDPISIMKSTSYANVCPNQFTQWNFYPMTKVPAAQGQSFGWHGILELFRILIPKTKFKRTHPPTSWKFFRIGQITCSLKFLEEFYLLFHLQEESRRYQSKNYDPQVIRKFGEFLDFRNHFLIRNQTYINNDTFLI